MKKLKAIAAELANGLKTEGDRSTSPKMEQL